MICGCYLSECVSHKALTLLQPDDRYYFQKSILPVIVVVRSFYKIKSLHVFVRVDIKCYNPGVMEFFFVCPHTCVQFIHIWSIHSFAITVWNLTRNRSWPHLKWYNNHEKKVLNLRRSWDTISRTHSVYICTVYICNPCRKRHSKSKWIMAALCGHTRQ